jgi:LacI family transcriptional regulator
VPDGNDAKGPSAGRLTSRDIAEAAGVSQATVSNVLNRPHLVAASTLERVSAVIRESGFVVNTSARNLRTGRTRTLGVLTLDLSNPYWGEVTRGIEATASARGYSLLLGTSEESEDTEQQFLRLFEEHRVDGILVSSVNLNSDALRMVRKRGTKVVFLDQTDPRGECSAVAFDHVLGAHMAARHLLDNGHTRVGFINGPHSMPWCQARLEGFRAGFAAGGLDPDVAVTELLIRSMTAYDVGPAVERIVDGDLGVTAIFCINDVVALGALKGLTERGIRVPQDISLLGFDDSYFSSMLSPALTTIRQRPFALGGKAAELIIDAADAEPAITVVFQPELVARDSVLDIR